MKGTAVAMATLMVVFTLVLGCTGDKSTEEDLLAKNHGRWQFIGMSHSNDYFYYNRELVKVTDGNTITLWIKKIEGVPARKAAAAKKQGAMDLPHSLYRLEVSCDKEEYCFLEAVDVDASGRRSQESIKDKEGKEWEAVIPDTVGHMWYKSACSTPESFDSKMWKIVRAVAEVLVEEEVKSDGGEEGK